MSMNLITSPYPTGAVGGIPTSNLLFEYKASSLLGADGSAISQWDDSPVNARPATQTTSGSKPTTKTGIINGLSVARFDGGDFLIFTNTGVLNAMSFYCVMKVTDNANRTLFAGNNNSAQIQIFNGQVYLVRVGVNILGHSTSILSTGTFYTISVIYDQAGGANNLKFLTNGSADGTITDSTDLSVGNDQMGSRNSGTTELFLGDIAHMMCYAATHDGSNQTLVHDYLRTTYAHY